MSPMRRSGSLTALILSAGFCYGASSVRADVIFADAASSLLLERAAGFGVLSHVTVASDAVVDHVGILASFASATSLKYVIYDRTTDSYPLISAPKSFSSSDGSSFLVSEAFAPVTLRPGHEYFIGASNSAPVFVFALYPPASRTQNGVTNQGGNGNFVAGSYAVPVVNPSNYALAQIPIQLYAPSVSAVPEPGSLELFAGMAALVACWHRSRDRRRDRSIEGASRPAGKFLEAN